MHAYFPAFSQASAFHPHLLASWGLHTFFCFSLHCEYAMFRHILCGSYLPVLCHHILVTLLLQPRVPSSSTPEWEALPSSPYTLQADPLLTLCTACPSSVPLSVEHQLKACCSRFRTYSCSSSFLLLLCGQQPWVRTQLQYHFEHPDSASMEDDQKSCCTFEFHYQISLMQFKFTHVSRFHVIIFIVYILYKIIYS